VQTQRQLQHSLEVHQRYIHKLMEQEGLAHKIPEMSAAFNAGALPPPGSVVSEAMPVQPLAAGSPQQQHHQQQQQQASSAAPPLQQPRMLLQQQQQQHASSGAAAAGTPRPSSSQQRELQQQHPQQSLQQQEQQEGQDAAGIDTLAESCGNLLSDHELLLGFPELRDSGEEAGGMGLLADPGEPSGKRQRLLAPDITKWPSGDSQQ
jgi:hypothetical protein